jgi:hypothetical protein
VAGTRITFYKSLPPLTLSERWPWFEPPIEPGLLERAAAAGVDLDSILGDVNAPLPHHRFSVTLPRAAELCAETKSLGAALLAALEKQDAEKLALTRARDETALLEQVRQVKSLQVQEAARGIETLYASRQVAVARYLHFQRLIGVQSPQVPDGPTNGQVASVPEVAPSPLADVKDENGIKTIQAEREETTWLAVANLFQQNAVSLDTMAVLINTLPKGHISPWGIGITIDPGPTATAAANVSRSMGSEASYRASRSARQAQFILRAHDWTFQSNQAAREIGQIDRQILAAQIRLDIANTELQNHDKQVENARGGGAPAHQVHQTGAVRLDGRPDLGGVLPDVSACL